ncbi:sensor histidine kinase [Micromonospora sp. HM5-17]|uniref:sensor histidine kinase n=1 Tax=Micromonospora sp. HM5-17 TaxID=2487710 RepID=UPI000F4A22A4|nr:sensor histidine kinase [Micromonospora sp. HM5-17]ROT29603.1 sensor histidine kinase [Micromonospora sp. HM5-17]
MTRSDAPTPVATVDQPRPTRWLRWPGRLRLSARQRQVLSQDALLALAAVAMEAVILLVDPAGVLAGYPEPPPFGVGTTVAWSIACAAPIVLRRLLPWSSVVLASPIVSAAALFQVRVVSAAMTVITLSYTTASRLPLWQAALAGIVVWAPSLVVAATAPVPSGPVAVSTGYVLVTQLLVALVCFFVGRTVHARRASVRALEERARVAEENQRALADQAVADERRRIARELHDVVAHHVSVMGVLATGARRVLPRDPSAADGALGTIEETSRTTLRELRRLLDVLRTDAEPAADLAPQPGLAGIEALVEQVREAGLPVTLRVEGNPGPLDPGVALTIYRIVQEALTNTLKHAGNATAQVRLSFGTHWLIVEVSDTGRGPAPENGRVGHGLVGMRERMALYGGTLRTGPRPGGGYRVYAKMPMEQLGAPASERNER